MRSRAIIALVSVLGSLGGSTGLGRTRRGGYWPAVFFLPRQAGYVATAARFRRVQSTVRLPMAADFSSEVGGFGMSVQLWTKTRVVVLGVSNGTAPGPYNAAVAVFSPSTPRPDLQHAAPAPRCALTSRPAGRAVRSASLPVTT